MSSQFDAEKYLTNLKGKKYLEVKWRLVWVRAEYPDAKIETTLEKLDDAFALFRARVSLPMGGEATGWGSETPTDFRDYIEKAETKAIGRALAALGYGTQFCDDHDFGADQGKVVDSPVERANRAKPAAPKNIDFPTASELAREAVDQGVVEVGYITAWCHERGVKKIVDAPERDRVELANLLANKLTEAQP